MPQPYSVLSLDEIVEACKKTNNADAWDEFILRTHKMLIATVASTLRRWGLYDSVHLDDIVQEVYLKISDDGAAILCRFQSQHPNAIAGYLRSVAVTVAHDYCRALRAAKRGDGRDKSLTDLDIAGLSTKPGGAESMERIVLIRQIDEILKQVTGETGGRDRIIFWLYYRQGLTAAAIASIPELGLTVKGVESLIHRLTRILRAEIGKAELRAPDAEWRIPKDIGSGKSL